MFRWIKQVFVPLLSFSGYLSTQFMSLNNKPCMISLTLIDLNPVSLISMHSWLVCINVIKDVMLLMTYLKKYVFPVKSGIWLLKYLIW